MIPGPEEETDFNAWGTVLLLAVLCWLLFAVGALALFAWPWGRV